MKVTIAEAARRLGYSREYVRQVVKQKRVKVDRFAKNMHFIEYQEIRKHLKRRDDE